MTGVVPLRVLIADDQAMIRGGFRMILEAETDMEVVGEADDGVAAVDLAKRLSPHVVVMDIRMPGLDGIAATKRLHAEMTPAPHVVVVTTFESDDALYDALRAGAEGFLLKNAPPEMLVDAVRAVAAGEGMLSPSVARRLIDHVARRPAGVHAVQQQALARLTDREREVLGCVAKGWSNAEIAAALSISHGTAKTHVARLLTKLDLRDRVQAVVLAYESGFVAGPDEPNRA